MTRLSQFLAAALAIGIQHYAKQYREIDLHYTLNELDPDLSLPKIETYDFIVVGGGTAGCLVAGRLSNFFSVLLLESGGNPPPAIANQFFSSSLAPFTEINHVFPVVKQDNYFLSTGGISDASVGKMMGGSGSHNENLYNRGSPHDYDYYANVTGDDSWNYANIVEQYKTFESMGGWLVDENQRHAYYARGGPLNVVTASHPFLNDWFQAGKELGFPIGDPNGYQIESFTPSVLSMRDSVRDSTYTAFIKRVEGRRNRLRVLRYSQVTRILVNEDKVAYGVTYLRHGIPQIARASKEVILSAGALLSPIILMKSGIGLKDMLNEAGIPVILDSPGVGEKLMEHPRMPLFFEPTNQAAASAYQTAATDIEIQEQLIKFQSRPRSGLLTMPWGPQAFVVSSRAKNEGEKNWPDIQMVMGNHFTLSQNVTNIFIAACLTRPKSRGWVRLNTTAYLAGEEDESKLILFNPGLLTDRTDVSTLVEGMKLVFKITKTTPFRKLGLKFLDNAPYECGRFQSGSDRHLGCLAAQTALFYYHFTGTCMMGRDDDPRAVVDSKLRVRGMKKLRVIDASVLPTSTDANSNAPVMVVAQKGACDIIMEYMNQGNSAQTLHNICPRPAKMSTKKDKE